MSVDIIIISFPLEHCKDTIPKIQNKYSQELLRPESVSSFCTPAKLSLHCNENPIYVFLFWNFAASVPISTFMTVSDLYILMIGLPIHSAAGKYVDDPGNI
jgi:hypothetical protein